VTSVNEADLDPTTLRVVEMLRAAEDARRNETLPAEPEQMVEEKRQSTTGMLLADNRAVVAPWGWMLTADTIAFTAHWGGGLFGWWGQFATVAVAASAIAARTFWHVRAKRLEQVVKTKETRRKIRRDARNTVASGTAWGLTAAMWTPIGHPYALMQLALLSGGITLSVPHWWRNRRQFTPAQPIAEIEAPKEDERLTRFRDHFCQTGAMREARLDSFEKVQGGFAFEVECAIAYRGTFKDIKNLEDAIAAFYDVPPDHVSVEPPKSRSHRRAHVTILTEVDAHEREERWDGRSTYNPHDGTFDLGRYADSKKSHWQMNVPYSGAAGGLSAGVVGSGKTGTLHVVACETGQAKLCVECLAEQSCQECDKRRIAAIWMGDPQRQPFGVYRGRADLTAWGPMSCVRMLHWMHTAGRNRAAVMGQMEWTDHLGRTNHGKGWFDPTPQFPLVVGVIDEWPMITGDPELAAWAVPLAVDILSEFRKVGLTLVLGTQEADVDILGERAMREALTAFNTCVHRTDRYAKQMLGIEGDPTHLAPGVPGLSYLNGKDRRSGIRQRTKSIREYLRPGETGVDVREIADRITAEPITYDAGILDAIVPLGYTGPGQVLSDDDGWDLSELMPEQDTAEPGISMPAAGATPVARNSVPPENIGRVEHTLRTRNSEGADLYDLMQATNLDALDVSRAVDVLIASGQATQTEDGSYQCA
jgi:hypothetical protein